MIVRHGIMVFDTFFYSTVEYLPPRKPLSSLGVGGVSLFMVYDWLVLACIIPWTHVIGPGKGVMADAQGSDKIWHVLSEWCQQIEQWMGQPTTRNCWLYWCTTVHARRHAWKTRLEWKRTTLTHTHTITNVNGKPCASKGTGIDDLVSWLFLVGKCCLSHDVILGLLRACLCTYAPRGLLARLSCVQRWAGGHQPCWPRTLSTETTIHTKKKKKERIEQKLLVKTPKWHQFQMHHF